MRTRNDVARERVIELLDYDMASGVFRWKNDVMYGRYRTLVRFPAGRVAGFDNGHGYIRICIDGKKYLAHRLAWLICHGRWPVGDLDHINGFRSDNSILNLREVTRTENNMRRWTGNLPATGVIGVSRNKRRFSASISIDKKLVHLGTFDTPEEAMAARAAAEKKHYPHITRYT